MKKIPKSLPLQTRTLQLVRSATTEGEGGDRSVAFALSSDTPIDMGDYYEVLSHEPGAIVEDRLRNGLPLLFNHDTNQHIGTLPEYSIEDGVLRLSGYFSRSELGEEKLQDYKDKILKDASVRYRTLKGIWMPGRDGDKPTLQVTQWEPFEGSLLPIAADITVGAGRAANTQDEFPVEIEERAASECSCECGSCVDGDCENCTNDDCDDDECRCEQRSARSAAKTNTNKRSLPVAVTVENDNSEALKAERQRAASIRKIGREALAQFKGRSALPFTEADIDKHVDDGNSESEFRAFVGDKMIEYHSRGIESRAVPHQVRNEMEQVEGREYSFRSVLLSAVQRKANNRHDIGFEVEMSQEIAKRTGISTSGILIPNNFKRFVNQRAMTSSGSVASVVSTETVPEVIELLRNRAKIIALGARVLSGLSGIIKFPRQSAAMTDSWAPETAAISTSDLSTDFVEVSPKRHGISATYSMELLAQSSPDVEGLIRADMGKVYALGTDYVGINGKSANNQPTGILQTTGVSSVVSSGAALTNGKAMSWADILSFENALAESNADVDSVGWLVTPGIRKVAKATQMFPTSSSAETIYPARPAKYGNGLEEGFLGQKTGVTNQMPKNFGANSNLHAAINGDFEQLLFADWGAVEVIFDEITQAENGMYKIHMRALQDVLIRHPQSFVVCTTAAVA